MEGTPQLCRTDEVGEICVLSGGTGTGYWGLPGLTASVFTLKPLSPEGAPVGEQTYTRTGLLGFLGPGGMHCTQYNIGHKSQKNKVTLCLFWWNKHFD